MTLHRGREGDRERERAKDGQRKNVKNRHREAPFEFKANCARVGWSRSSTPMQYLLYCTSSCSLTLYHSFGTLTNRAHCSPSRGQV